LNHFILIGVAAIEVSKTIDKFLISFIWRVILGMVDYVCCRISFSILSSSEAFIFRCCQNNHTIEKRRLRMNLTIICICFIVGRFSEFRPNFKVLQLFGFCHISGALVPSEGLFEKFSLGKISWEVYQDPSVHIGGKKCIDIFLNFSWRLDSFCTLLSFWICFSSFISLCLLKLFF